MKDKEAVDKPLYIMITFVVRVDWKHTLRISRSYDKLADR